MVPRRKGRWRLPTEEESKRLVALVRNLAIAIGIGWAATKPDQKARDNQEGLGAYAVQLEARVTAQGIEIDKLKALVRARRKVLVVDTLRAVVVEKKPGFWARLFAPTGR